MNEYKIHGAELTKLNIPEYSDWECQLFGMGNAIVFRPLKGRVPNRFWRCMQYICFGHKWIRRNERTN